MQYIFLAESGNDEVILKKESEEYNYLFKIRREKLNNFIFSRETTSNFIYKYQIIFLDRRKAILKLISQEEKIVKNRTEIDLVAVWCIVDSKTIEKTIASLNEIGVHKLIFVYCDYSQKNIQVDLERLNRILKTSSMQSGRNSTMQIELYNNNLENLLNKHKNIAVIDFSENILNCETSKQINSFLVGPEGGFSESERAIFKNLDIKTFRLNSDIILKSSTAVVSVSGKILL
jgi:16S rRNA (uracil1498-N3)-methyltransferase